MPNPIKGEGVMVKINGVEYPLVFSLDAIAIIEDKYDKLISEVQTMMPRVSVTLELLSAGVVGYDGEISGDVDVPPLVELQALIIKALHVAYFGKVIVDDDEPKKKAKKKTQPPVPRT